MRLRLVAGGCLFALALVPWFLSILVSPYDTMGTSYRNIVWSVADNIFYWALASIVLLLSSGVLLLARTNVRGWRRVAIAAMFTILLATAIARALWVKLYVIDRLPEAVAVQQ